MRILVFNTIAAPPFIGGAERSVRALCAELGSRGHSVVLVGLRAPAGRTPTVVDEGLYRTVTVPIPNLFWPWSRRRRSVIASAAFHVLDIWSPRAHLLVARIIARERPALVVTNNLRGWSFAPWLLARRRRIPLLHITRDYSLICVRDTLLRDGRRCERLCGDCSVRALAAHHAWPEERAQMGGVSRAVLEVQESRGFPRTSEWVIEHPSVPSEPVPEPRTGLVDGPRLTVGYLGRLSAEKGIGVLLEALRGSTIALRVAGTPEGDVPLPVNQPNVDFVGVADASTFLDSVDLLIVPSIWFEPFGRVVAEAAARRVPVLVSDVPGLVEAATSSGARFRVFEAGDVTALRRELDRTMDDTTWLFEPQNKPAFSRSVLAFVDRLAANADTAVGT